MVDERPADPGSHTDLNAPRRLVRSARELDKEFKSAHFADSLAWLASSPSGRGFRLPVDKEREQWADGAGGKMLSTAIAGLSDTLEQCERQSLKKVTWITDKMYLIAFFGVTLLTVGIDIGFESQPDPALRWPFRSPLTTFR